MKRRCKIDMSNKSYYQRNNEKTEKKSENRANDIDIMMKSMIRVQTELAASVKKLAEMQTQQPQCVYPMFVPYSPNSNPMGNIDSVSSQTDVDERIAALQEKNKVQKENIKNYKDEIYRLREENKILKEQKGGSDIGDDALLAAEEEIGKLRETVDSLRMQVKEREQNEENEETSYNIVIMQKDEMIENLQNELEEKSALVLNLKEVSDKLVSELENREKENNIKDEEIEKWKNEFYDMEYLVQYDSKFVCKNANAFNSEFIERNLDSTVLGVVDIRDLDAINMENGKNVGDQAIEVLVDELKNTFEEEDVYRVMGSKFFVIAEKEPGALVEMQNKFKTISNSVGDQGIEISYAIVDCSLCNEYVEVMEKLDRAYRDVRKGVRQKFIDEKSKEHDTERTDKKLEERKEAEKEEIVEESSSSGILDITDSYLFNVAMDNFDDED